MIFGPCGGVRPSGGCEVDERRCSFVDRPLPTWKPTVPAKPGRQPQPVSCEPSAALLITDLHVAPRRMDSLRQVTNQLRGSCDFVLVGDHGGRRNDFPPSFMASSLLGQGVAPWVTLSCRDRNRVALSAECAALAELGVAGVHCVTGDWRGLSGDTGETHVFDLDAFRLVDMARSHGLTVSVAEAPAAPPTELRPSRLAEKVRAGAQLCFVNHAGGPRPVQTFVERARAEVSDVAFVPCVSVLSDPASQRALAALPGLVLDAGAAHAAEQAGGGQGGVRIAAAEAEAMLAIDGVVGINLSGAASAVSEATSAGLMAELGRLIRGGTRG